MSLTFFWKVLIFQHWRCHFESRQIDWRHVALVTRFIRAHALVLLFRSVLCLFTFWISRKKEGKRKKMSRKIGQFFRRFFNNSSQTFSKPYTVIVEGNIGSGKTTFLQPFTKHSGLVEVLPEPVEKWRNLQGHNLLQKLYEDPRKYSLLLQTYIQLTMVQLHCKPCPTPVRIMERSLLRQHAVFFIFDPKWNSAKWQRARRGLPVTPFHFAEIYIKVI